MALEDFFMSQIPKLANFLFTLISVMAGSFTIVGEGWGKIRSDNQFQPFWKLFAYFITEIVIFSYASDFASAYIEGLLIENLKYIVGITAAVIGTFFIWFVYTLDYDIMTQNKWAFPAVCYAITFINYAMYNR